MPAPYVLGGHDRSVALNRLYAAVRELMERGLALLDDETSPHA
jgi:hypothetical protein